MAMYSGSIGVTNEFLADLNAAALSRRTVGLQSGMESIGVMLEDQTTRRALTKAYGEPVYRLDHVRSALVILQVGKEVGEVMKYLRDHKVPTDAKGENKSYARRSTLVEAMDPSGIRINVNHLEAVLR